MRTKLIAGMFMSMGTLVYSMEGENKKQIDENQPIFANYNNSILKEIYYDNCKFEIVYNFNIPPLELPLFGPKSLQPVPSFRDLKKFSGQLAENK
jgi:hypothetical protein